MAKSAIKTVAVFEILMYKRYLLIPLLLVLLVKYRLSSLLSSSFLKDHRKENGCESQAGLYPFFLAGPQVFKQVDWSKEETSGEIEELAIQAPFYTFSGPFQLKNAALSYQGQKDRRARRTNP